MNQIQEIYSSVGFAIKNHRVLLNMSIKEICNSIDEERANYRAIENGTRPISLRKIIKIADGLNCDVTVSIVSRDLDC